MTTTRAPVRRGRRASPFPGLLLTVALPLLAAGCVTERGAGGTGHVIAIEVENDLVPRSPVTVRLLSNDRPVRVLGTVSAGNTREFRYREDLLTGVYRLVAEVNQGQALPSRTFTLYPRAHVFWSINNNDLTVGTQELEAP